MLAYNLDKNYKAMMIVLIHCDGIILVEHHFFIKKMKTKQLDDFDCCFFFLGIIK